MDGTSDSRLSAALVIVAAGEGRRLGAPVRKALVEVAGRPLVAHTLARLLGDGGPIDLEPVVLVGHRDDRALLEDLVAALPVAVTVVDGGARRQDSVAAGLAAAGSADLVLVHDAARPFVPVAALAPLAEAAREVGCALLATRVADTIKEDDGAGRVARTVPREPLRSAQTPQAFRRGDLAELLERADAEGLTVTDEASLFERAGRPVRLVEGSPLNIKVTTPDDLALAAALLAAGI